MLNEFVNWLINEIQTNLSVTAYSPQLPINTGKACAVTLLGGITENGLCTNELYTNVPFRIITRGINDEESLQLAESLKTLLNNTYNQSLTTANVISINANSPIFVDVDENNQVYYNVDFTLNIE